MAQTCLPDQLFTDPRFQWLARKEARLFVLLVRLERLRDQSEGFINEISEWGVAWELGRPQTQLHKDLVKLRELGLMQPDSYDLIFCRRNEVQEVEP